MAQENNRRDEKDTIKTGRDIPGGDGTVSDEDMKAIDGRKAGKRTEKGQDHSLEDYEKTMPTSGVGAVQSRSDTTSDIADIDE
ncbi:MAG: hypothetical protein WKF71_20060 [Pyrinomonadaceae bacterium]